MDDEEYTLTPVDVDNKRYSISYKGKTYVGDYDYLMLESQGNPKILLVINSSKTRRLSPPLFTGYLSLR